MYKELLIHQVEAPRHILIVWSDFLLFTHLDIETSLRSF